jgi:transcriptional regulator with XRE-family HTH domain
LAQRTSKHNREQIQPEPGPEKAFGQALREIRQSTKISQERLALDCGLDRTYISLIERGINSPSIRVVVKIAAILKVPASRIIRRMEELLKA